MREVAQSHTTAQSWLWLGQWWPCQAPFSVAKSDTLQVPSLPDSTLRSSGSLHFGASSTP
jgi:hypothetical protein